MRTKDVLEALNISRERIKYYKKEKVFAPEKGSVNGRADYTNNDLENLKRLVILSKVGLSCADIRKMQEKAGRPLKEIAETRKESIFKDPPHNCAQTIHIIPATQISRKSAIQALYLHTK